MITEMQSKFDTTMEPRLNNINIIPNYNYRG